MTNSNQSFWYEIVMISKENHANFDMPYHSHDRTEIVYCVSGFTRYYQENVAGFSALDEKKFILIRENIVHKFESENSSVLVFELQKNYDSRFAAINELFPEDFSDMISRPHIILEDTLNILNFLELIQIKFSAKKVTENQNFYNSMMFCLFEEIFEQFKLSKETQNVGNIHLNKAVKYINSRFKKQITALEVANHIGLSQQYLRKLFVEYCKMNIVEYIAHKRIEESKSYLKHTKLTIAEIAKKVGYNSSQCLKKNFLHIEQCTPKEYKRNYATTYRKFALKEELHLSNDEVKSIIVQES